MESNISPRPDGLPDPARTSESIPRNTAPNPAALDELRRAEILVHTRYPDPGPAYPLGIGLFAGVCIASFALPVVLMVVTIISMSIFMTVLLRTYVNCRGTLPDARKAPAPLRREMVIMALAYLGIAAAGGMLWVVTPWWVVAVSGAIASGVATEIYARRFARAAKRVETEAGIEPLVVA